MAADASPYAGKTDFQVFEMAKQALLKEAALPPRSIERSIQGLAFDSAMAELNRRAMVHVLAGIRKEQE